MNEPPPIEVVTAALSRVGSELRRGKARCPAHDDREPSLSVTETPDGTVLLNCHAGCDHQAVMTALGLLDIQLYPTKLADTNGTMVLNEYEYETDPPMRVVRRSPKGFHQQHLENGEWVNGGVRDTVLYMRREVQDAAARADVVYVTEGEKDAEAIYRLGIVATTNPGGAGKWLARYNQDLLGARRVIVVADKDEAGRVHAQAVADSVRQVVPDVVIVEAAVGKDVSDHLAAGLGIDELVPLGSTEIGDYPEDDALPHPIDWSEFVKRDSTDRRWLVEGFWPWGRAMALWAKSKAGKSELALWCAAKLAMGQDPWTGDPADPLHVGYFDYEMTEDDLDDRLAAFDFDPLRLENLHYFLLPSLYGLDTELGGIQIEQLVERHRLDVVVIDTFSRAATGEEDKADTVKDFYRHTGMRLKRMGVAYLRTDHAGKDTSRGQRGSSAKRDDIDVAWFQEQTKEGVRLNCDGVSRLPWVGPKLELRRIETNGILSYSMPIRIGWPNGTHAKAGDLDAANVPLDAGRPTAVRTLRAAGIPPGKTDVLEAALKYRRERAAQARGQVAGAARGQPGAAAPTISGAVSGQTPPQPPDQEEPEGAA